MARLLLILLFACLPASLLAAEPFARAEVLTKGSIIAGQQIELAVDILVPSFFKSAPDFPVFELPDAIVTLPESRAINLVETVDGTQFAGIRRSYAVIPEREGNYALPPVKIAVTYADDSGAAKNGFVALPHAVFSVEAVPGDWQGQTPLVATDVTVTQSLDRDPATLEAGDTLVRTVTVAAAGTQAMMIPALGFEAPAGVKIYRKNPTLTDQGSDASDPDASLRREAVTYLMEKGGSFDLPAVSVRWLDPAGKKLAIAAAPAIKAVVKAAPPDTQAIPTTSKADTIDMAATRRAIDRMLGKTALQGALALGIFAILYLLGGYIRKAWLRHAGNYAQSEQFRFHELEKALAGSDDRAAYRALDAWVRRLGFRSISEWSLSTQDADLQHKVSAFEHSLFGRPEADLPAAPVCDLGRTIATVRRDHLKAARHKNVAQAVLPPLNP